MLCRLSGGGGSDGRRSLVFVLIFPIRDLFAKMYLPLGSLVVFVLVVIHISSKGGNESSIVVVARCEEQVESMLQHVVVVNVLDDVLGGVVI